MVQTNNLGSQSHHVWRRRRNVLLLLLACGIVAVYVAIPPSGIEYNLAGFLTIRNHQDYDRRSPGLMSNASRVKNILLFTAFFGTEDWWLGDRMGSAMFESTCPVSNCRITNDRAQLSSISEFDAVLFHYRDMVVNPGLPDQQQRRPDQRYVMFFVESPQNYRYDYDRFSDFFNWTMTYRSDSDIPAPYGRVVPKSSGFSYMPYAGEERPWEHLYDPTKFATSLDSKPKEFRNLAKRPKAVAWIVSHCDTESDRESYVRELKNHIQVDVFGSCGSGKCEDCPATVARDYMFYLSFENSLCDQYVTEKLWRWLKKDIVPVVMGQHNYSAIAPPHSVINAMDFPEPKDLATHLRRLMSNETEYLSHFWWKEFYEVREGRSSAYCKLCQMLNDQDQPPKVRGHLNDWWSTGGNCKPKGTHAWSKYKSEPVLGGWLG